MRTTSMQNTFVPLNERYFCTQSAKWDPNNNFPTLLNLTGSQFDAGPLLDNTHTPRGAKKAITLERAFNHVPWMYNRTASEGFDPKIISKDKAKSKILRKIIRGSRSRSRSKSGLKKRN